MLHYKPRYQFGNAQGCQRHSQAPFGAIIWPIQTIARLLGKIGSLDRSHARQCTSFWLCSVSGRHAARVRKRCSGVIHCIAQRRCCCTTQERYGRRRLLSRAGWDADIRDLCYAAVTLLCLLICSCIPTPPPSTADNSSYAASQLSRNGRVTAPSPLLSHALLGLRAQADT